MTKKPRYEYLFDLLDYADELIRLIPSEQNQWDRSSYFISLVYIEDILDKYGRSMIHQSGLEYGDSNLAKSLLQQANQRMDLLRQQIRNFSQRYDFDGTLKAKGEQIFNDWHKLPDDHPNV